ncbi:E4 [Tursiops truncatus papillomavirus 4]|uniref:E4 n=1 Tax=Tursiops truncatus papillomavirus 4 TaxID=1144380 RepID=H6UYN5_9PAPI|nr:E4 [Tursiops truncatus papillomavirus 4]
MIVHLYLAHLPPTPPWDTPLYRHLRDCQNNRRQACKDSLEKKYLDLPPRLPPLHLQHHQHQGHPHHHQHHDQNVTDNKPAQQEQGKEKPLQEVVIPVEDPVTVTVTVTLSNGSELTLAFLVS